MRRKLTSLLRAALCALFLLTLTQAASAQFRAAVQGTVTDPSGAVVPAATLTLTNKETGRVQTATSGDEGFYRISELPPGTYTLTVEKAGFKKTTFDSVVVNAEQVQGLDVVLTAGEVSEVVTVTADQTPALETENANVSRAITTQEVLRLPQVGRDPYELARLAPGVFGTGARSGSGGSVNLPNTSGPGGSNNSIFQTENQVPISANGQRVSSNNFQVDGVSVNSQTWGGAAVITPSQEAVKEVRVTSSTYSAEDGRNSGAQIKVVTQSGTNSFHGSLFFKYNDPGLNSFNKSPFTPTRVENKFRQFGGSIGGPIVRDKLFFFFAYEGLRNKTNTPYRAFVETAQYRQLVRSARPNSTTALVFADPGIEPRIISAIPVTCAFANFGGSNCQAVAGGLDIGSPTGARGQYVRFDDPTGAGLDGVPDIQYALLGNPTSFRGHQFHTRLDYTITEKDSLAVTTIFVPTHNLGADTGARSRPDADINSDRLNWNAAFIYNRTLSATALNEARFNVTRWGYDEVASNPDVNFGIPRIEVESYSFDRIRFGANRGEGSPGIFKETSFDFRDTLNKVFGTHALKFGVEARREVNNGGLTGGGRPIYSFSGLWNLANDTPIFEAINLDPNTGKPATGAREIHTGNYGGFVQDDWKFRPNVTLNLGLRYELFQPISVADGQFGNLVFGPHGLQDSRVVAVDKLHKTDKNNFGPQLGFAWSPNFGNAFGGMLNENRAVVRGGFGIGYNRLPNALLLNARANPPFFARYNLCCGGSGTAGEEWATPFANGQIVYATGSDTSPFSYPVHPALAQGIDPATGAPRTGAVEIYGTEPNQPNAYVYRYSLEGQYELPYKLTGTLGYQGSTGHKLVRIVNENFVYTPNPAFFAVYFATPDVNTSYNAMNARLQRRFDRGFQFDAQYRWAKSLDTVSYDAPTALTNQTFPADNHTERGPSDYDVKHYFTLSGLWDLPFLTGRKDWAGRLLGGWELSAILTANSGFPWTPKLDSNIRLPNGNFFGPIRPVAYFGGALNDTSNDAFLRPNGNFPGGGAHYFSTTVRTDANGFPQYNLNFPGIGRNSFRGPRYRDVDISLVKRIGLGSVFGMNESAGLDLRANFFNIFNIQNLKPFLADSDSVFVNRSGFGRATDVLAGRVIELQARFNF
ncbi:MAG: TonB-dependent receptor [Acidobacteria bacterium]|nr:TonB-dependent receptor [Acidobacteriota bacterium]